MKQVILLFLYLVASLQSDAQNCIDTVRISGYYVIKRLESEIAPSINKNRNLSNVVQRFDVHRTASFIPCDSISRKYPLSFWLNHFYKDTHQVFISCEKIDLKYLVANCPKVDSSKKEKCLFPTLKTVILYKTTNMNTGDVFEIYFIDALWAKVKINKESIGASMIPSRIVETAISQNVKEFDLYYFLRYDHLQINPEIKDAHVKVWNR